MFSLITVIRSRRRDGLSEAPYRPWGRSLFCKSPVQSPLFRREQCLLIFWPKNQREVSQQEGGRTERMSAGEISGKSRERHMNGRRTAGSQEDKQAWEPKKTGQKRLLGQVLHSALYDMIWYFALYTCHLLSCSLFGMEFRLGLISEVQTRLKT